jgi:hypothetical protein
MQAVKDRELTPMAMDDTFSFTTAEVVPTADISFAQADFLPGDVRYGIISGTGFTPNSPITISRTYTPGGGPITSTEWETDATGAFTTGEAFNVCFVANTSVEVTVTDGARVSVTESFPLSCG